MKFFKKLLARKLRVGPYFGSTTYELQKFSQGIGDAAIFESEILIKNYPFEPSIIFPSKTIKSTEINEIHLGFPPTLKLNGELIFISFEKKDELQKFAEMHKIRVVKRNSNWDFITEPFLDTEFSEEEREKTLQLLSENGLNMTEIEQLRSEIENQMFKYNFDTMLWDWCNLGLFDVLVAMSAKYDGADFEKFYWKAMEIEMRGKNSFDEIGDNFPTK